MNDDGYIFAGKYRRRGTIINTEDSSIQVVGIGASAGGIDALKEFFSGMPNDSGLAFVIIQHLDPDHVSYMASLLAKCTEMKVVQAGDEMPTDANCVYTIPPGKFLLLKNGMLHLAEPVKNDGIRLPVDFFFRSLAQDQHEKAIGVLLSGSGSDGTLGIREIRGAGGIVIVQDPKTAQFDSMAQSAVATGLVDYVLSVKQMPEVLLRYVRQPNFEGGDPSDSEALQNDINAILHLMLSQTKSDFRPYRTATIQRRIFRRMGINQMDKMSDYVRFLRENPAELASLSRDMLIGVTSFFRDPEAFEELRGKVIAPLVQKKDKDNPLRVWIAGCATGEEAYSIVMLLMEEVARGVKNFPLQVFASDIDPEALKYAREATYPESVAVDVSEERLARFFIKKDHVYQINKAVREAITFAQHNVITDPPFLKMDLISCRNLLIYIEPEMQKKILNLVGFALNPGGYLLLGKAESAIERSNLFEPVSRSFRIYRRKESVPVQAANFPVRPPGAPVRLVPRPERPPVKLLDLNQQVLLKHFNASIVLIAESGDILHFYGPSHKYLAHPLGDANLNLFDLIESRHSSKLRRALEKAARGNPKVTLDGLDFSRDDSTCFANVTITPVVEPKSGERLLAVIFEEARLPREASPVEASPVSPRGTEISDDALVKQLEAEIKTLKEELQATNDDFQTAHEGFTAANEEVLAINEELQSTNEELETSKEELQSVNEELITLNNQLNEKVEELSKTNDDLANFLNSSEVATVFLDTKFCVRRFTPSTTKLMNLIPVDLGRPVSHISNKFIAVDLLAIADNVLKNLVPIEKEVQTSDGSWHIMGCLPYRTLNNVIDGVVFTFMDITRLKCSEEALLEARNYAESIVHTTRESLIVLNPNLNVVSANRVFCETFKVTPEETEGHLIYELGNRQWDIPRLRELLQAVFLTDAPFEDFEMEHDFPTVGRKIMSLNARKIYSESKDLRLILLAIDDVTAHRRAERGLKELNETLEKRVMIQVGAAHLLQKIAAAANTALSVEDVLQFTVEQVSVHFGWAAGHAYFADTLGGKIKYSSIWYAEDSTDIVPFRHATEALPLVPGIDLPGWVPSSDNSVWILDVTSPNVSRAKQAKAAGIKWGLAFPIVVKNTIVGVLEFLSRQAQVVDDPLSAVLCQIGVQLGQVFERKWAQIKLRESERFAALGIATAKIAHEISNPLSSMYTLTQLLERHFNTHKESTETVIENVGALKLEIERLKSLLEEIRSVSSPNLHRLELEPSSLSLLAVEVLMKEQTNYMERGVRVEQDFPSDLPPVMVDRKKMIQVLFNLYKNAVEGMPGGGTLTVRGYQSGEWVCLEIADTGVGIPQGLNVFELFTTTKPAGTGIGLMVVQQIVSAHNGSIDYTSELGKGTVFRISLPLNEMGKTRT